MQKINLFEKSMSLVLLDAQLRGKTMLRCFHMTIHVLHYNFMHFAMLLFKATCVVLMILYACLLIHASLGINIRFSL